MKIGILKDKMQDYEKAIDQMKIDPAPEALY
jgi:hypothetical protein